MVKVKSPAVVGVPERRPPELKVRPVGRVPLLTVKIGLGAPDAVN
jgi:hypothetical protein